MSYQSANHATDQQPLHAAFTPALFTAKHSTFGTAHSVAVDSAVLLAIWSADERSKHATLRPAHRVPYQSAV
jgi:hypothetical protein